MHSKLMKQVVLYFLVFSSGSLYAQSPGGVARQSVWLKGSFFADSVSNRSLNFNRATSLDNNGSQIKFPGNMEDLRRATIFTVYQFPAVGQDVPVWKMKGGFGDLLLSSRQVYSESGKTKMVYEKTGEETNGLKKPEAVISTYVRQQNSSAAGEQVNNNGVDINFGNHTGQSNGLVAEFIVYETILKEKEVSRIESYLAIKYGITLQKNYVNSLGETIWSKKNEEAYSNNIAGIGRDDRSTLYQKQGTSSSSPDQLVIGINKIAASNGVNAATINDKDYLVWGDNAKDFTLNLNAARPQTDILLSEKKWLMKLSGKTARTISTELKINTRSILPNDLPGEYFCLVIDRSGTGDFEPKNCTYVMPDNISADGIASFGGLHWDTDGSGKDAFSFGLKTRLSPDPNRPVSFQVYPNPLTNGHYNVVVTLDKPADITVSIYDIHLQLIESKKASGQASYVLPGTIHGAAGVYLVKLFTNDKEFSQLLIKP